MKKLYLVVIVCILSYSVSACDICGCGLGNYYIGLLPQFNHKFFGLRYQFSSFHTRLQADPTQFSRDFFQTVELWGGWNIGKKWQLLAFVPYNFSHQVSDEGTKNRNGFGDVTIIANYKVFDLASSDRKNLVTQQLWFGGGIKLPTGKFNVDASDPAVAAIANGQSGTGSTDFLLNAIYNLHLGKAGFSANASYRINSENRAKYKYGNKFSGAGFGYYTYKVSGINLSPNIGVLYERSAANYLNGSKINETNGYAVMGAVGIEMNFGKFTTGANIQAPLKQNFASGQTETRLKGMLHVTYTL